MEFSPLLLHYNFFFFQASRWTGPENWRRTYSGGGAEILRACNDLSLSFHFVSAIMLVSYMCFVKLHISSEKSLYLFKVLSMTWLWIPVTDTVNTLVGIRESIRASLRLSLGFAALQVIAFCLHGCLKLSVIQADWSWQREHRRDPQKEKHKLSTNRTRFLLHINCPQLW